MSAEYYYAGHTDKDLARARKKAEALLTRDGSALDHLNQVARTLHEDKEGSVELSRMKRVAEFVCSPDELARNSELAAFIYGELAAENLLVHLTNTSYTAGSYAHEFLKYRMEESRLGDIETIKSGGTFTHAEERESHRNTAEWVRSELLGEYGALPEPYEEHLDTLLELLENEKISPHHFIMGFRIVMKEFHQPSSVEDYDEILLETERYVPVIKNEPDYSDQSPSDRPLDEITNLVADPLTLESLSNIKKGLIQQHVNHIVAFRDVSEGNADETTSLAIQRFQETQLRSYNLRNELLAPNDIIFAQGNQAACVHEDGETRWATLSDHAQIIGTFQTIVVINAPNQHAVMNGIATNSAEAHRNLLRETISTPALRLSDPVIVVNGQTLHQEGVTIDIPLLYKHVALERLARGQFEDTIES